jgi:hypothetical protein
MKADNQSLKKRRLRNIAARRNRREDEIRDEIYRMITFLNKIDDQKYYGTNMTGHNHVKESA